MIGTLIQPGASTPVQPFTIGPGNTVGFPGDVNVAGSLQAGAVTASQRFRLINATEIAFADSPYALVPGNATLLVDATAGNVVVNLPLINGNALGVFVEVHKTDASANTVTINRNGANVIGFAGAVSVILAAQDDSFLAHAILTAANLGVWKQ